MSLNKKKIFVLASAIIGILLVLLITYLYFYYHDLKTILLIKMSNKATSLIGQKVDIGDISFSPSGKIVLNVITIQNPEDFGSGKLFSLQKLHLKLKLQELLKGEFHFTNIGVHSPELFILKDAKGKVNISEKLKLFFSRKPTYTYRIDEITIHSGIFEFNKDTRYRVDNVNITLNNLSSYPGIKTLFKGTLSYLQKTKIKTDGWAYLKDEPRKFSVSLSSDDIDLSPFRESLRKYRISAQESKMTMSIHVEGDTDKGAHLSSKVEVREAGFFYLKRIPKKIILNMNAFLGIRENTIVVNNISILSGDIAALRIKGIIKDVRESPSYKAEITLDRINLSAFNFIKGLDIRGLLTSNKLHIRGTFQKKMPEISGTIQLRDGAVTTNDMNVKTANAHMVFLKGESVKAEASAEIFRVKNYSLDRPAHFRITLNTDKKFERISFLSSVNIPPFRIKVKEKTAYLNGSTVTVNGTVNQKTFTGESSFEVLGLQYADYAIPRLKGRTGIEYRKNLIIIKDLDVKTGDFYALVRKINIQSSKDMQKHTIVVKSVHASYPKKKADLRNIDFSLKLRTERDALSGDVTFSSAHAVIYDVNCTVISGSGRFDKRNFNIEIPQIKISDGKVRLTAEGKISNGPFPLKMNVGADNIDLGLLSRSIPRLLELPYHVSGNFKSVTFNGTIQSTESVYGNALVDAKKITLLKKDSKRNILKNATVDSEITFNGGDIQFKANTAAGNVSTHVQGFIHRFSEEDRFIRIKADLPEINVADIREVFWDVFPDSLLYAGLNGSIASVLSVDYSIRDLKVNGTAVIKDFKLEGENNEYTIGPINGVIPIAYAKTDKEHKTISIPPFERSKFESLIKFYSQTDMEDGFSKVTIGSLRYGFRLIEDIEIWMKQEGTVLNIGRLRGNILGGNFYGSGLLDISKEVHYRISVLIKELSLARLCEEIEPIKGYISGKVDGVATIKGSGKGISQIIGKADFWTYKTKREKTRISKEFLKKIGGPSLKTYLGDRNFDKGIMTLYIQNGYIIFDEFEISNRNFIGIQDLSIKVAPFNNRISIDHLMWSITEAAHRAQKK